MNTSYRIKSRFRFAAFIFLCIMIAVTIFNTLFGDVRASGMSDVPKTVEISIDSGDTLWGVAETFMPEMDRRKAVNIIKEINDLQSSVIKPGETIKVPINN